MRLIISILNSFFIKSHNCLFCNCLNTCMPKSLEILRYVIIVIYN